MFDLEADGFLEDSTKVHCLVGRDLETEEVAQFHGNTLEDIGKYLDTAEIIVGHNIIGYDLDMLKKYLGWVPKKGTTLVDTMIMSRVLDPDRQLPKGCPTSYRNPVTGKLERVTPHSIAAWGYRVGRKKPEHYEWGEFSEAMLHRCSEDVDIQTLVLYELLKEAEVSIEELLEIGVKV